MSEVTTCPSGLSGVLRKLKVKEANILADSSGVRAGTTLTEVLQACWTETHDVGPYEPMLSGAPHFNKVLLADRFYLLVELRRLTYGDDYAFEFQCQEQSCRQRTEWQVDLSKLPVRAVPPESLVSFKDANRFEAMLPSIETRVWFQLQTGEGEIRAAQQAQKSAKFKGSRRNKLTLALASRIVEIEGIHANDRVRWLEELDMDDVAWLMAAMDDADGGVETTVEVECAACGASMELDLPFGKTFWLPTLGKKARSI